MDEKILIEMIDRAIRDEVTELNLSGLGIAELPPAVGQIVSLRELDLSRNQLTNFPLSICHLNSLKMLNLSGNQLSELPSEISLLKALVHINLAGNRLTTLPAEIKYLSNLTTLILSENHLTSLPVEIGQLRGLTTFYVVNNQISELLPEIGELRNLASFDLSGNRLAELPDEIGRLDRLTTLDVSNNQLVTLPSAIGQLRNLTKLVLWTNKLATLPAEFGQLYNLTALDVFDNQIASLPPEMQNLSRYIQLDLRKNPIAIPPEILDRVDNSFEIIRYYFRYVKTSDEKKRLNEAKLILVGQGSVGKTSLAKRLFNQGFSEHEPATGGIAITAWPITAGEQEIMLNVWDFGGQEIMHATHQFFLTKRSLYILVLDARQGEQDNRIDYWLKIIQSFGGDSPIIVVINKIDAYLLSLDQRGLQAKYPSIQAFVNTSCKTNEGIENLRSTIKEVVMQLEHLDTTILASWLNVKQQLQRMRRDYIQYGDFVRLCEAQGINDEVSQRTLSRFLHDLGVILSFQDDQRVEDTNILNPEWVTNAVYRILNSITLFHSGGILEIKQLEDILDSSRYPYSTHLFIIEMMRKFELCFDHTGEHKKYLIPDLLPKEEPYLDWINIPDSLRFEYHYDVLPNSIISRFIVRMNSYIAGQTYWRNGVVVRNATNQALVKADLRDNRISIYVSGNNNETRSDFLSLIRSQFQHIHSSISGIKATEKIPLPNKPDIVVDYRHLLLLESKNISDFIPEGYEDYISVVDLLDAVASRHQRQQDFHALLNQRKHIDKLYKPQVAVDSATAQVSAVKQTNTLWPLLVGFVVVVAVIAIISKWVPVFTLSIVITSSVLIYVLISVIYMRIRGDVSEDNLLKLLAEVLKRISLIRK